MNTPKSGIKTTEFWLTIANTALMALVAFGVVGQPDADELGGLVAPLIGAVVPIVAYIYSRAKVKAG